MQANKEHLSAYFRPLPPSLALKQDGQAAWALVSSNQIIIHQCHQYTRCSFHVRSQSKRFKRDWHCQCIVLTGAGYAGVWISDGEAGQGSGPDLLNNWTVTLFWQILGCDTLYINHQKEVKTECLARSFKQNDTFGILLTNVCLSQKPPTGWKEVEKYWDFLITVSGLKIVHFCPFCHFVLAQNGVHL